MRYIKQSFWNAFKCIAGACPKTCCSGWQIMIDDASMKKYISCSGSFAEELRHSVNTVESCFYQKRNGDCVFLQTDGLCRMILQAGEEMLCDTCRLYPRHVEEYPDLREWCLSISCPEAARILAEQTELTDYLVEEDDEPDPLDEEFDDFDFLFFDRLEESRAVMDSIIRNTGYSLSERIYLLLQLAEKLQLAVDDGDYASADQHIQDFQAEEYQTAILAENGFSISAFLKETLPVLYKLERLDPEWHHLLALTEEYPAEDTMHIGILRNTDEKQHERILANILLSYLYTYYLGSVYNGMLYAYTKLCIFAVLLIDALALCSSQRQKQPITLEEYTELIYRCDREIEHSDDNISILLEYFDL
ncbi:MAG: flagellin lysine-N-methylase [Eubacteriales bacterium]|nr:flagellin lysine-N-methylase [Eubacteriales bacterium]